MDENKVNLDAEAQDVDTGVDNETNDSSNAVDDERYLSQKRRAEKAEAEAKALREQLEANKSSASPEAKKQEFTSNDRDETYLVSLFGSKGLGYDEINTYLEKAKKIAQIEGVPLVKAVETDFFKMFDKSFQEEKKLAKASLNASKGSGSGTAKKTFSTPGLSDNEFDEMLKKQIYGR